MAETVLIVDDEESVRRTFLEWLAGSGLPVRVFAAADSEAALLLANEHPIDLAVLDWNLGSGSDGLRLLEDLVEFRPDIVAILITGYAHQATPLDALRNGVRDYLDKNQELTREQFLAAVKRQLDRIVPAKRERAVNQTLAAFRQAVEQVLPLVRGAAALNDPVPLPDAVRGLFRFLLRTTGATDGALLVRHTADGADVMAAFNPDGQPLDTGRVPFHQSLAASVVSMQEPGVMTDLDSATGVALMPFERGRASVLAAPLRVGAGVQVVMELFDKPAFTADDRRLAAVGADLGAELLRAAVSERQTHRLLFDAVEAALRASADVSSVLAGPTPDAPPPAAVMETLKLGLNADANALIDADTGLELVEAVRVLAVRHGPEAVRHCLRTVRSLRELLDGITG